MVRTVIERSTGRVLTEEETAEKFPRCPVCADFVLDGDAFWEISVIGHKDWPPVLTLEIHNACAAGGIRVDTTAVASMDQLRDGSVEEVICRG